MCLGEGGEGIQGLLARSQLPPSLTTAFRRWPSPSDQPQLTTNPLQWPLCPLRSAYSAPQTSPSQVPNPHKPQPAPG